MAVQDKTVINLDTAVSANSLLKDRASTRPEIII